MCGIVGFVQKKYFADDLNKICRQMTDRLIHRGPDDSDTWVDANVGLALGHRRLAILDLSLAGRQPMHSACGRYVVVFNGEIYNYQEIRQDLESAWQGNSVQWRGTSDTEIMLAAISYWGLEEAVKRFIGMFAFALWDRQDRVLQLVRDRMGEKPLYYGFLGDTFLFGSELKAFRAHPLWKGEINRDALTLFLKYSYIPAPHSIFRRIYKLLPGTILTVPVGNDSPVREAIIPVPKPYWSARDVAERGTAAPFTGSETEAVEYLDQLLRSSITQQMIADVPLGAFLSGGVDSSTIVAIMQSQSNRPVKTFTIGFYEEDFNESKYAQAVAQHLGTEHTELYLKPEQALKVVPMLPELYDEPFSDPSQIPTFLLSQLTRKHVTVSLSGDAGDELFGGYNRYFWGRSIWKSIGWMSQGTRKLASTCFSSLSPMMWGLLFRRFSPLLPKKVIYKNPADKMQKFVEILNVDNPIDMYQKLISHWKDPSSVVLNASEPRTALTERIQWAGVEDFVRMMMYLDLVTYLPDDILVKVDRAAMSVSLETRIPFLNHRVMEFAWQIPLSMKVRKGRGKWLLRRVLHKYVPDDLIDRPKTGLGVPLDSWLRGPLRAWAEDLLKVKRLQEEGYLNPSPIREKWQEHLSRKGNWQYLLWDVLMFQAWLSRNI